MVEHNKDNAQRRRYERAYTLRKQFGLSYDQYLELLVHQDGRCAICREAPKPPMRYLSVDHCHRTGKIRGLLCKSCNLALGCMLDSPERLQAAAEYLEKE